ncbi:MAG: DUF4837 family protein [Gemmatimonadales bacterium]|nr:MAG: DUF4837 family protein [Gemmatimonadales bacterium]
MTPSRSRSSNRTLRAARTAISILPFALLVITACAKPPAFGEANSLIVVGNEALWQELEAETYQQLERTVFTTREENTFNVTFVAPGGSELDELLMWKQVLVFGVQGDPLIEAIAAKARTTPEAGAIQQARDVWARGQVATAIVLEGGREADSWRSALPEVAALIDDQYRSFALTRMFVSGEDTLLSRTLAERYGVQLRAPNIYHGEIGDDGLVRLRNDNPRPSERIRSILIERVEIDADEAPLDPDAIFAWREGIDSLMYIVSQGFERAPVEPRYLDLGGANAIEVRGVWQDEGTFPAGGPFIARAVRCPDATWFFDAWLYSPNPRASKYEFLLQLEEILDSFRCT